MTNRIYFSLSVIFLYLWVASSGNAADMLLKVLDESITYNENPGFPKVLSNYREAHTILTDFTESRELKKPIITLLECDEEEHPYRGRRQTIYYPLQWSYAFQGSLETSYLGGTHSKGSGILVGPHHVLTAGDCCYSHEFGYPTKITFSFGGNSDYFLLGKISAAKSYVFRKWVEGKDKEYDIGLILLNSSVGERTGWAGMVHYYEHTSLKDRTFYITEHPKDKEWLTQKNKLKVLKTGKNIIIHDMNMSSYKEQIGRVILDRNRVLGVQIAGTRGKNLGVLLAADKFTSIIKLIKSSWEIPVNLDRISDSSTPDDIEISRCLLEEKEDRPKQKKKEKYEDESDQTASKPSSSQASVLEKKEPSASPFKWLDDEVMEVDNLQQTTKELLTNKDGYWKNQEKEPPQMVRYLKKIEKGDIATIQQWLNLDGLKYFGITDTDNSPNVSLISSWYEQNKNKDEDDISQKEFYKLIYLNAEATLHKLNFNIGDFPDEWLENHRQYHRWNSHYRY